MRMVVMDNIFKLLNFTPARKLFVGRAKSLVTGTSVNKRT